jgi:hypothetical protein
MAQLHPYTTQQKTPFGNRWTQCCSLWHHPTYCRAPPTPQPRKPPVLQEAQTKQ